MVRNDKQAGRPPSTNDLEPPVVQVEDGELGFCAGHDGLGVARPDAEEPARARGAQTGELQLGAHPAAAAAAVHLRDELRHAERSCRTATRPEQQTPRPISATTPHTITAMRVRRAGAHGDDHDDHGGLQGDRQQAGARSREHEQHGGGEQRQGGERHDGRAPPDVRQQQDERPAERKIGTEVVGVVEEAGGFAVVLVQRRGGGQVEMEPHFDGPDQQREAVDRPQAEQHPDQAPARESGGGRGRRRRAHAGQQQQVVQAGVALGRPGQGEHQPAEPGAEQQGEGRPLKAKATPHDDQPDQAPVADERTAPRERRRSA